MTLGGSGLVSKNLTELIVSKLMTSEDWQAWLKTQNINFINFKPNDYKFIYRLVKKYHRFKQQTGSALRNTLANQLTVI